ncbi:hypothetical protein [Aquimarina sp. 2201CG5-10]|uniref:hypothetical protein n=1 Tax=Aquimarina callyspongiae TaxID=3098150 RepID=UPI002AB3D750|nr:hypothetical protein [Aquimarina sp. 2201CG5-10]MDY8138877.1 hypothetical protein [Aquimarina sp. 2201CG5-10]
MHKKIAVIITLLIISYTLFSCGGSDDAQEPEIVIDPDPIPGKTSTYEADVKSIMEAHCTECHSNPPTQGAPMSLETYQEVVNSVNNRDLFARMATTNSFNVMPESGRLPQATIDIVEDWIADGLIEQ